MYAYKTNSPHYLDYVASLKTREQILADPDLCPLLENPYIKDNMEIALRWNKAKYGDYQDKYDFLEYLMCNGPELDADTILHYRLRAYNDPVCMEIAYSYLSDTQKLAEIRKEKYEKLVDDCFKNPCFYMGKFSAMMGNCGDVNNTKNAWNMIRSWGQKLFDDNEAEIKKKKRVQQGVLSESSTTGSTTTEGSTGGKKGKNGETSSGDDSVVTGSQDVVAPAGGGEETLSGNFMGCRKVWDTVILPTMKKGANMIWAQITENNYDFTKELVENVHTATNIKHIGDWMATPVSEMLDLVTKANVRRQLGDCARLWSQVRRLRLFSSDNHFGPIRADQVVSETNTDGTPQQVVGNPQPSSTDASRTAAQARDEVEAAKKKKTSKKPKTSTPKTETDAQTDAANLEATASRDLLNDGGTQDIETLDAVMEVPLENSFAAEHESDAIFLANLNKKGWSPPSSGGGGLLIYQNKTTGSATLRGQ